MSGNNSDYQVCAEKGHLFTPPIHPSSLARCLRCQKYLVVEEKRLLNNSVDASTLLKHKIESGNRIG